MKFYDDLSPVQQQRAVRLTVERLAYAVTDCGLRFDDLHNGNDLQARIDAAQSEGQYERTADAWRAEILRTCMPELLVLAQESARTAVFTEGETSIAVEDL